MCVQFTMFKKLVGTNCAKKVVEVAFTIIGCKKNKLTSSSSILSVIKILTGINSIKLWPNW